MIGVVDGAGVTISIVGGVAKEEAASSLGVPPDFECSCLVGQNRLYNILFPSTTG
jgi:hypothetical protein